MSSRFAAPLVVLVAAVAAAVVHTVVTTQPGGTAVARRLVARIRTNDDRDASLCALLALGRYYEPPPNEPEPCRRRHVRAIVDSPAQPRVYAAILESDLVQQEDAGAVGRRAHLVQRRRLRDSGIRGRESARLD